MEVQGWVVIALAFVLFGYLVPHLVNSRQQLAQARVEDRFSGTLRVVATGATAKRSSPGEHHGTTGSRPYLHGPRRRTEAPAVNRPTTPSERAASEARRLAAARAARAAEISRRKAAARRRLVLTLVLLLISAGGWLGFGLASLSIAVAVVPTVLLGAVLLLGRRAARISARRNAADRAAMARLELRPRTRPARPAVGATAGRATAAGDAATMAGDAATTAGDAATTAGDAATTAQPGQERRAATTGGSAMAGEEGAPSSSAGVLAEPGGGATSAPGAEDSVAGETTGLPGTDSGWTPVPVPAPSYTLKAPAPRRDIAPYEPPAAEPPAGEQVAAQQATEPVVAAGLAGSPYAPVADPDHAPAPAPAPQARPARGMDIDSVLARRRGA